MAYDIELKMDAPLDINTVGVDASKMSDSEKAEVQRIKNGITFDYESVSTYGKDVTKKLTDFSTQVLETVKVKDAPEIEGMLLTLVGELNQFNTSELTEKKKGLFARLFKSSGTEEFVTKYKSISQVISETKGKLEEAEYQLQKDIKTSEAYLQMNRDYIHDLDKYILAADMRIKEERADIEEQRKHIKSYDTFSVQELSVRESDLNKLEKKLFNLCIQRTIAIQNIPQLMLIKDGDAVLISKIDDSITQAIPLWESQIVIGISAMRQKAGAAIAKSVSDTTNNLLTQNAQILKQSAVEVATENERPIVDLETLRKVNDALIDTINGVRQVQIQGAAKREAGIKELTQIQSRLNQALIETS